MSVNLLSINMSLTSVVAQQGLDILPVTHVLLCYVLQATCMSGDQKSVQNYQLPKYEIIFIYFCFVPSLPSTDSSPNFWSTVSSFLSPFLLLHVSLLLSFTQFLPFHTHPFLFTFPILLYIISTLSPIFRTLILSLSHFSPIRVSSTPVPSLSLP